ncbi:MAG: hypothetical protein U1E89_24095 [Burkholderiaceae bacterium]
MVVGHAGCFAVRLLPAAKLLDLAEKGRTLVLQVGDAPQYRRGVGNPTGQTNCAADLVGQTIRAALQTGNPAPVDLFAAGHCLHRGPYSLDGRFGQEIFAQPPEHGSLDVGGHQLSPLAQAIETAPIAVPRLTVGLKQSGQQQR